MDYEVEAKFWNQGDDDGLMRRLQQAGASLFASAVTQSDSYFKHPSRDFKTTDEAFRIRAEGELNWLTYKGPKIDSETKTRQEVEVSLEPGADARRRMAEMLACLGFREAGTVTKRRSACVLRWEGRPVKVVRDEIAGLGRFVELETIAAADDWASARDALQRLATVLQLQQTERRSYLELLQADCEGGGGIR